MKVSILYYNPKWPRFQIWTTREWKDSNLMEAVPKIIYAYGMKGFKVIKIYWLNMKNEPTPYDYPPGAA